MFARRARVALTGALALFTAAAAVFPATATAATGNQAPIGKVERTTRSGNVVTVWGWAADPDQPSARVTVSLTVDHRMAAHVVTGLARADIARTYHVGSHTGWDAHLTLTPGTHGICGYTADTATGALRSLGCIAATVPSANQAIAHLAAHYVGARYVEGGNSPRTGFDCSGFTQYVYGAAAHISLVHYTQTQYAHARVVARSRAVAGDLVFFHDSSGYVYHVGVYAGRNMMWAAATPKDGVRYQSIWSSAVTFGTYTHR